MPATELILSPATLPEDAVEVARIADAWGVTEPVTVIPYTDENRMTHFTAYLKAEYDVSEDCPYRKEE